MVLVDAFMFGLMYSCCEWVFIWFGLMFCLWSLMLIVLLFSGVYLFWFYVGGLVVWSDC